MSAGLGDIIKHEDFHGNEVSAKVIEVDEDAQMVCVEYTAVNGFQFQSWILNFELEVCNMVQPEFDLDDIELAEIIMDELK